MQCFRSIKYQNVLYRQFLFYFFLSDDAAVNPLVLYISIPSVVLIFMLVPLVVVVVCVRRQRKRSARLSGRFEGLILEGKDIGGKEPDDESKLMQFCYPLEYSTSNELDIPLGKFSLSLSPFLCLTYLFGSCMAAKGCGLTSVETFVHYVVLCRRKLYF